MSASEKNQYTEVKGEKIKYWRSIENRRRTKAYLASIENEFAESMTEISSMDRRSMLKVMGATIAMSGIGISCRRPEEKILPYVRTPEDVIPGIPNFFATAQPTPFGAQSVLLESHEGRPTKVEGNPSHPESLGKASLISQASVLELYDPDRSRYCTKLEASARTPKEWVEFDDMMAELARDLKAKHGEAFGIVSGANLSPTFLRLKARIKEHLPKTKFYVHEPMRMRNIEQGTALAFGPHRRVRYHLDKAKVIATVFADPFSFGPDHLSHMRGFAKNREVKNPAEALNMNRLYAIEADFSLAGTNADHRLRLPLGIAPTFLKALAWELRANFNVELDSQIPGAKSLATLIAKPPSFAGLDKKFLMVLAKDLATNRGQALLVPGDHLDPESVALVHLLNVALQGHGRCFELLSIDDKREQEHLAEPDIVALANDLKSQRVQTLLMLGVNPVYDAPRHLKFDELIKNTPISIHAGNNTDETAVLAGWHVPLTHYLEHFADDRSFDGHVSIVQPLIEPLHKARPALSIMAQLLGLEDINPYKLVKDTFIERYPLASSDRDFNKAIHDGLVTHSAYPKASLSLQADLVYASFDKIKSRMPNKDNLELILNFDRRLLDGRYANHSWLQELPDTVTKLNWGNALLMSPKAAKEFGIKSGVVKNAYVADIVNVHANDTHHELPVFVMPGLADYSLIIWLGHGRTNAGEVGNNVGVDVYSLVKSYDDLAHHGVKIEILPKTTQLSSTQEQFAMNADTVQSIDAFTMHGRDPARMTRVADYVKKPLAAKNVGLTPNLLVPEPNKKEPVPLQMTKSWDYSTGNQWGMVIDLAKCTGCNACVVACQSENNIPVVGKEQVIRGRGMWWLRVDRYFEGSVHDPLAVTQPVPCQHCENAPCEPVCPVAATSHDREGLNAMTYNRCVGTRYCANNCPFKVRRFNYFDFSHSGDIYVEESIVQRQKTLKLQRNPDVTVRYRGVMEKCTYCTQRIQEAKMDARRKGKDYNNLHDGAVTPACAQTCPSEAIVFGNINDENSRVSKLKRLDRNYTLLDVLNVRPRTSYLSLLRNPNPELVS